MYFNILAKYLPWAAVKGKKNNNLERPRRPMFGVPAAPIVLKLPQGHEDSEYVLSFEIGQRESGFYSERTE